jgi:hypothetical protein
MLKLRIRHGGVGNKNWRDEKCIRSFSSKKPEVKKPLGRPRRRWEDNIEVDVI